MLTAGKVQLWEIDNRLKVALFNSKPYTGKIFREQNRVRYAVKYFETRLEPDTVAMAEGALAVCVFVNDNVNAPVIERLSRLGIEIIVLRSAGYNNVDLKA